MHDEKIMINNSSYAQPIMAIVVIMLWRLLSRDCQEINVCLLEVHTDSDSTRLWSKWHR